MRMVTACFARAPSRCMNDTYVHLLLKFHEVRLVSNTRYSNLVDDDAMSVGSAFLTKEDLQGLVNRLG